MSDPSSYSDWPKDWPLPKDEIFALGIVALNYGQLEGVFQYLFAAVVGIDDAQVSALFQRLPNNHRRDILAQLMAQSPLPDSLRESVAHFSSGFQICADNRHDLMHSRSGGVFVDSKLSTHGLLLHKTTKSGVIMTCKPTLADLRRVADETYAYTLYGALVISDVRNFLHYREKGDEGMALRFALRDRPQSPTPLSWHSGKKPEPQDTPPRP